MTQTQCSSQTYWYESGVQRARYCGQPATQITEALDGSRNHSCDPCAISAIEAGARLVTQTQEPADDTYLLAKQDKARCPWCKQVFRIEDLTDSMLCRPCYGDE